MKRLTLFAAALAFAGCLDFDSAYQQYVAQHDGGALGGGSATGGGSALGGGDGSMGGGSATGGGDGSTGGGSTTGGGDGSTGGGATTGGGVGSTGGGSATGGGDGSTGGGSTTGGGDGSTGGGSATGGGEPDAGCINGWCPYLEYVAPQIASAPEFPRQNHVMGMTALNLNSFSIWVNRFSGPAFDWNYIFTDGGVTAFNRTASVIGQVQGYDGLSPTDCWLATDYGAQHYVNGTPTNYQSFQAPGGGTLTDPDFFGAHVAAPDDVWFVGYPALICRWDGTTAYCTTQNTSGSMYLYDAYRTPLGELYAVGWQSGGNGIVINQNGVPQGHAPVNDDYGWAFVKIDGVDDRVYVVSRTGEILERGADGGFDITYVTNDPDNGHVPYDLWALDVTPTGNAWAAGVNSKVLFTDGSVGGWSEITLPFSGNHPRVSWQQIAETSDGLFLAGSEDQGDGGWRIIVNAFRRQP